MSESHKKDRHDAADALKRLCARLGIDTGYDDIWGIRHDAAPAALAALAAEFVGPAQRQPAAMPDTDADADAEANSSEAPQEDVDAEATLNEEVARQALRALHDADWREALPPVAVVGAGQAAWSVRLRLPATRTRLRWQLREEGGARHAATVETGALPEAGRAEIDGETRIERRLDIGVALPAGYHRLSVEGLDGETLVVSAPAHCHRPDALRGDGRLWGPAVQLYALRSRHNWGIGDFSDLAQFAEQAARQGAGLIGLNPLHALFAHNPAHASPYSPSSRLQLNALYIDVEAVPDFQDCDAARRRVRAPEFQARLAALREAPLVDYPAVAALKFEVLELLYAHFCDRHLDGGGASVHARDAEGQAFLDFVAERGEALRRHALFEALQASFHAADPAVWGWPVWPAAYRDPEGPAVARFAAEHAGRVRFHQYLQWQAARQLSRAGERCRALGLPVGLYLDLAVSVDRAGSDVWSHQGAFAAEAAIGAPPDEFNPNGQGWGLPPLRADRLRASGYRVFIDTLRACMRGAGALRIDHVMGLMRLFWIPPGRSARDGAYVHYALDEMLAIVALESCRNRCMVIGEDLGTVADEMRDALARSEVLSYRLLYFEREADGAFKAPGAYPRNALVAVSTHDLATLAGWWCGHDLRLRLRLGLFPDRQVFEKQLLDRALERVRLLLAVQEAGLLAPDAVAEASGAAAPSAPVVEAIHAFLAATPSQLMLVQLEDVLGAVEQANMPGTTDAQPNWRRKLPLGLEDIAADGRFASLARALSALRPVAAGAALPAGGAETRVVPRATYRLQFHKGFGFDDAVAVLPYLARLGVSHVYCSPIQRARPGSTHGYDVVAHDEINPELGGPAGFERFCAALREHGMGQLLDLVPNHMGVLGADNAWWMDVLENGPASLYAQHFDIDWQPLNAEMAGKVLVPVLGDHYGDVLSRGELVLAFEPAAGSLALHYFEHRFPLAPRSYPAVLEAALGRVGDVDLAASLASIASAFGHLPGHEDTRAGAMVERARDKELLKARLARLVARQPAVAQALAAAVDGFSLEGARDALHALIEAQAYRLAYWRVAADEINYRRFFDINELAALRMERDEVFEATQGFALDLAAAGRVDGLRIDHPDGLYDPAQYFRRLQEGFARRAGFTLPAEGGDGRPARPLYVVAEKIAAPHEEVPEDWPLHGTTGYRFANVANGVLVDGEAAARFGRIWRHFTGVTDDFATLARLAKRDIMRSALASELTVLATELLRIARADRRTRDHTLNTLRRALADVAACLPVYRTYIVETPSAQDLRYIDWAVDEARRHGEAVDASVFDFVRQTLLGQAVEGADAALCERVRRLAVRFQQFSAPVAAKGVEDTAFYRYFPLSSLNEVGGEPAQFGLGVAEFHEASADRAARWPHTMLATSTHDNKRSEDVRNRIDVLSEMPATWRLVLRRWQRLNAPVRDAHRGPGGEAPSAADEYLLYQTLLGTLPAGGLTPEGLDDYRGRIVAYMQKATREAKLYTRWTAPDAAYEAALQGFVQGLLARLDDNPFLDELQALGATLAGYGALNSLTLTLLKYGSPGVPDLYQGNELMDLSLVDPDNRRPVDYALRERFLATLAQRAQAPDLAGFARDLAAAPHDGRAKLWVVWRLLAWRREQPALWQGGGYTALAAQGAQAAHVVAFERRHAEQALVVVAGRLFCRLAAAAGTDAPTGAAPLPLGRVAWGETAVLLPGWPDGTRFENVLTGEVLTLADGALRMADAFASFPAAALRPL